MLVAYSEVNPDTAITVVVTVTIAMTVIVAVAVTEGVP